MPGGNYVLDKGFVVITTAVAQFTLVKQVAGQPEQCTVVSATTDLPIGVIQQSVATADLAKQVADVRIMGISKAIAGGTVAVGDKVKTDAAGKVVTNAIGTLANVVGIALSGGVVNDIIDVVLTPGNRDAAS
jgi:hypothetical protein